MRDHPKAIELFLREAQSAARLNHPNIVTVYDTDQEDGAFFITMELLEGVPINQILKQRGRITPRNTVQLGVQIAGGLEYGHAKGIVHRDIKSANLFFTHDKVVKIMDFGLAKMMEEVRRGTTVIGGTPYYMAPEQAAGETVDERADIYALGVTLYELVTGSVPFTDGDVTYHHRHTPVPDPRTRAPEIPEELAELLREMLEKQPADRLANAALARQRLEQMIR
jgi:serine/threonine protein kinase